MSVFRHTRTAALPLVLSVTAVLACSEHTPLAPPELHRSSDRGTATATLGWHALARSLVSSNSLGPPAAARLYALLSAAQYGAVTEKRKHHGRSRDFERGAIAGASSVVLAFIFPSQADALEQRVNDEAAAAGRHFPGGVAAGKEMGDRLVAWANADRFTVPFTGTIPVGTGKWFSSGAPLVGPTLGGVAPYFLASGDQFRPPPPVEFNSPAFLTDLAEIRQISDTRTSEQLAIAQFWAYGAGTPTPPGYWSEHAARLIEARGLNERQATHVFALMTTAMMDAAIGCWDTKYFYYYIRPSQVDSAITLPLGLPNHPSFPSGHSCISAAATTVLADFFPKEARDLANQLEEAGLSRMYGCIHYRFDIAAGQALGRSVGRLAIRLDKKKGLLFRIP